VGVSGSPPWCVYFLAWCWREVNGHPNSKPNAPWDGYGYGGFGHTFNVHEWARGNGHLVATPVSGVLYGEQDGWSHTGLVIGVNPKTLELFTINGNWGGRVGLQTWSHLGGRQWRYGSRSFTLFFCHW
jgi:hypothetical protein